MTPAAFATFKRERDEALRTLDPVLLDAYCRKYHVAQPTDPHTRLAGFHKAREACRSLPGSVRAESRAWLKQHGWRTMQENIDAGDAM